MKNTDEPRVRRTAVAAIRAKCVDCCGGQRGEVVRCESTQCALHPFRLGNGGQQPCR